jgi:hypothetical protein
MKILFFISTFISKGSSFSINKVSDSSGMVVSEGLWVASS